MARVALGRRLSADCAGFDIRKSQSITIHLNLLEEEKSNDIQRTCSMCIKQSPAGPFWPFNFWMDRLLMTRLDEKLGTISASPTTAPTSLRRFLRFRGSRSWQGGGIHRGRAQDCMDEKIPASRT